MEGLYIYVLRLLFSKKINNISWEINIERTKTHNKGKKLGEKKEKYTVLRLSNIYKVR